MTRAFATEADLCAAFIAALPAGWTAYAETGGWDILLVRADDAFQVGVQAKLRLNAIVLAQAIEDHWGDRESPDCRAVLVPNGDGPLAKIAHHIGVTVIVMREPSQYDGRTGWWIRPSLPMPDPEPEYEWLDREWFPQYPAQRCRLPDYIPDVQAGAPAPVRLTAWKIRAIKVAVILEVRGWIGREDFQALKLDHRRWIAGGNGWLQPGGLGWVAGPRMPDFRVQHPRNFEEIRADAAAWMPEPRPAQERLGLGGCA